MSVAGQGGLWSPSGVQVWVLRARGLRVPGEGSYAVLRVAGQEVRTAVAAARSEAPEWKELARFDLPPPGRHEHAESSTLRVHVMHRSLVGPDKTLGGAVINLLDLQDVPSRSTTEWFKLLDKAGKADKERGDVLLDIQFTRNNMTSSMIDLSAMDKSRSRLGKFKDKLRGKKKDGGAGLDSASAVVPSSFTQVLTDSEGEEGEAGVEGAAGDTRQKKSKKKLKLKSLFSHKSNLQKNMSQSMSVLGNQVVSGSRSSGLNVESSEGKKKFKFGIHKRSGSSDSKVSPGSPCSPDLPQHDAARPGTAEPQARAGSRASSTFSLSSSGRGSMEDLHRVQGGSTEGSFSSYDSLQVPKQQSLPWTSSKATEEEEKEEEDVKEYEWMRRKEEEEKARQEKQMRIERRREEEEEEEQRKRRDEEKMRREEMEKREVEEEDRIRREREEEEMRRLQEEEQRFRREQEERARIEEEREEEERERVRMEEEEERERDRMKEEMERIDKERAEKERECLEEEWIRMEREEEERKKREWEEEKERNRIEKEREEEERERVRMEKEEERERVRMEKEEEEERERVRMEKEEEEERERDRMKEEMERIEKERAKKERERLEEERIRVEREEEERKKREWKEEKERIRIEKEREEEERERVRMEEEEEERERVRMEEEEERERVRMEEEEERERIRMEKEEEEERERDRMKEEIERIQKERAKKERERLEEEQIRMEREERKKREWEEEKERIRIEKEREEEERERVRMEEEEERERVRMEEEEERERDRMEERERDRMEKEREEERREEEETARIEKERKRQEAERIWIEEEKENKRREERERTRKKESLLEEERIRRQEERQEEEEREHVKEEQRREDERRESEEERDELEEELMTKQENTSFDIRSTHDSDKSPGTPAGGGPVCSEDHLHPPAGTLGCRATNVPTAKPSPASRGPPPLLFEPSNPFFEDLECEYEDHLTEKKCRAPLPPSNQELPQDRNIQMIHTKRTCDASKPPRHTKGPAPSKPNRTNVLLPLHEGRPACAQRPARFCNTNILSGQNTVLDQSTYGSNPFDDSEDDNDDGIHPADQDELIPGTFSHPMSSVLNISPKHLSGAEAQTPASANESSSSKSRSLKKVRAPLPPEDKESNPMNQSRSVDSKTKDVVSSSARLIGLALSSSLKPPETAQETRAELLETPTRSPWCGETSEKKPAVRLWRTEATTQQVVRVETATGPASHRSHPVKPLSPSEQPSATSSVSAGEGNSASEIRDDMKVKEDEERRPFSQLTRGELLSLLQKLQSQLKQRDSKISELEHYIDNLLVRIMEEEPSILMSLSSLKH